MECDIHEKAVPERNGAHRRRVGQQSYEAVLQQLEHHLLRGGDIRLCSGAVALHVHVPLEPRLIKLLRYDCYLGYGSTRIGYNTSSKLGFFGTTPVTRQTVASSATVATLITALKAYGLIG